MDDCSSIIPLLDQSKAIRIVRFGEGQNLSHRAGTRYKINRTYDTKTLVRLLVVISIRAINATVASSPNKAMKTDDATVASVLNRESTVRRHSVGVAYHLTAETHRWHTLSCDRVRPSWTDVLKLRVSIYRYLFGHLVSLKSLLVISRVCPLIFYRLVLNHWQNLAIVAIPHNFSQDFSKCLFTEETIFIFNSSNRR